ncbi:hypothetical protein GCM10010969_16630 [Saccharibacillus kuerlensis]|uniref:Uncharacterized protein n=1 Tax=Saccharibacillus kuerlensis TaxID=459527 RepID=A0ABQ2KZZ9_9BACL|nr:hypothetical protein GCM10010969_16630 [Saccharibacillus kuerlensis]
MYDRMSSPKTLSPPGDNKAVEKVSTAFLYVLLVKRLRQMFLNLVLEGNRVLFAYGKAGRYFVKKFYFNSTG